MYFRHHQRIILTNYTNKALLPLGSTKESFIYQKDVCILLIRREKRTKLEIFYYILTAIQNEASSGEVKPTRVQQRCNLSFDKFSRYLEALRNEDLIHDSSITITEKGKKLLQDYDKIKDFLNKMKLEYVGNEEVLHCG